MAEFTGDQPWLGRPPRSPLLSRRSAVLVTACCGVFVSFGSLFISTFGIFLKPVSQALGWSRAEISSGFTAAVLSVAIMSPWLGQMLDRVPAGVSCCRALSSMH